MLVSRTFRLWVAAAVFACLAASLPAQQWIDVSPQDAASHLIKSAPPVYPAFARAAGLEGVVRIGVGITEDGRVGSIEVESGPPALKQAATDALLQYRYKPFEKDGQRVNAKTTVDVVFRLPASANRPHFGPVPGVTPDVFESRFQAASGVPNLSLEFRKWLAGDATKMRAECDTTSAPGNSAPAPDGSLTSVTIVQVPAGSGTFLYIVRFPKSCRCGGTGNCPIDLAEDGARGVRQIDDTEGWGYYVRAGKGLNAPDIFIASTMGGGLQYIAGYVKVSGYWGQLYCGELSGDDDPRSKVEVCH